MTIKQIYQLAIDLGLKNDLRGKAQVKKYLQYQRQKYDKLTKEAKQSFDQERLTNPYADSLILNLAQKVNQPIKKILAGIDIDTAELLLADKLGDIDLIISHHPRGKALANLSQAEKNIKTEEGQEGLTELKEVCQNL